MFFCIEKSRLHRAAARTHFAILLVRDCEPDGREADEHVYESFEPHPRTEDHVDDVPVGTANEPSEAHESPVEATNHQKDEGDHVHCFHAVEYFVLSDKRPFAP